MLLNDYRKKKNNWIFLFILFFKLCAICVSHWNKVSEFQGIIQQHWYKLDPNRNTLNLVGFLIPILFLFFMFVYSVFSARKTKNIFNRIFIACNTIPCCNFFFINFFICVKILQCVIKQKCIFFKKKKRNYLRRKQRHFHSIRSSSFYPSPH